MGYSVHRLFAVLFTQCLILLVICCSHSFAEGLSVKPDEELMSQWSPESTKIPSPQIEMPGEGQGGGGQRAFPVEKRVDVKKEMVAFVEVISVKPAALYIMYPTQYKKYADTGSTEGVSEYKNLTWLMYPVPALLEDQTVYFVSPGNVRPEDVKINVTYENINERVDRLMKGEEMLRGWKEDTGKALKKLRKRSS